MTDADNRPAVVGQVERPVRPDLERAAFEAWAAKRWGREAHRHTSATCAEWDAWQASQAHSGCRIFELEQRCAALEEQADLDTIRMGRLTESNQKLKDLNREMFVSRCQAHMSAEAAEQDAARFRMLLQQTKHWLGVFACDPDGTPSDSLDHAELTERLDALIAQEPAREA